MKLLPDWARIWLSRIAQTAAAACCGEKNTDTSRGEEDVPEIDGIDSDSDDSIEATWPSDQEMSSGDESIDPPVGNRPPACWGEYTDRDSVKLCDDCVIDADSVPTDASQASSISLNIKDGTGTCI